MPKRKNRLGLVLKFLFSISIIAFLLIKKIPLSDIGQAVGGVDFFWLLLSFSLHALGLLISARRWQILIHAQGDRVPFGYLVQSYLVGNFFNLFLPTRFGGDVMRIWDGSRYSRSLLKSSAIVLVERLTGIIVLLVFATTASLLRLDMTQKYPIIWVSLAIGLAGLVCVIVFFLPIASTILAKIPERGLLAKVKAKIIEFRSIVLVYRENKAVFLQALYWALLLQINVILHYFLVGIAFRIPIPFIDYFIFMPIVLLVLTIPVTISGLGLREMLYIEIFKLYEVPNALAFSFSLIADILFTFIIGTAGGIIYIFRKEGPPRP
ncbi:MAG: flippase-like domain-containing protein [Candidatus Aminicenantes bacterium]|nr:flippase-like domain-containing protein [Candidatus Aminicenantes bacterium]